jgi:hypothetical protein
LFINQGLNMAITVKLAGAKTIELKHPVMQGDTELTELTMNRPSFGLIRKLDLPFEFGANESIKPKMEIVGKYIESCAALPPSVVNSLSFVDVMECFKVLKDFFID